MVNPSDPGGTPAFTIVVPTYNRREVVLEAMEALALVERPWPIELVVVVDGSSDGTYEAARAVEMPFPTQVVMQANSGAARARNHGAELARGRYLLFLDDDMIVKPDIVVRHEERLSDGADAVVGHMDVHPTSPGGLLKQAVEAWSEDRRRRLAADENLTIDDLLTGQLSVRADLFAQVRGFDSAFNEDGRFGGEDTDFGLRLGAIGARLAYEPAAVSYQKYVITPQQYLRQWSDAGRGDALLARKHPETRTTLVNRHRRPLLRSVFRFGPRLVPAPLRRSVVARVLDRVHAGYTDRVTGFAFLAIREGGYWASFDAEERRAASARAPRVLAYHQVEPGDHASTPYSVTTAQLQSHLAALDEEGYRYIDADQYLAAVAGEGSDSKDVLLTFDDGYTDLLAEVVPVVERFGISPVTFVVTGLMGRWNAWDAVEQQSGVPLLDVAGLQELHRRGWEIGSHSRTHAHLGQLGPATLRDELATPVTDLTDAGLPAPRLVAYPYGEHNALVRHRARRAGYRAAFALRTTGTARRQGRMMRPRLEVGRDTSAADLLSQLEDPPTEAWAARLRLELRGLLALVNGLRRTGPTRVDVP